MTGQQQKLLQPVWKQDMLIIYKDYTPMGAKALILLEFSSIEEHYCFIPIKWTGHL